MGSSQEEITTSRCLRKDAAENRAKLLDAARSVFAGNGVDAPLEAIAAEAGVGIATLYRRFPSREDLLAALVSEELDAYLQALVDGLAMGDPWEGFCAFLERMCQLQARNPGLCDAPFLTQPCNRSLDEGRAQMQRLLRELIERAQKQGTLRPDVTTEDVALVAWGNAGIIANAAKASPDALRRYLQFMLDAFHMD